ncbi:MAG: esterase family protein [Oscillochloris sp.]|nr:esterase family protein [Oscillochloris sp.]
MRREYVAWWSPHLQRRMELLVFGHAGARVLVFPTRGGRFYDYENWGLVESLRQTLDQGHVQLYCVDSIDRESLYAHYRPPWERIARHRQYEAYILDEVLPLSEWRNPSPALIAHGCSLGAYHAVALAFRHPGRFRKVVALSGRYDLTASVGHYRDLFDGHYDETIYFHTPCHFLPQLSEPAMLDALRRLEITLAVGEADVFLSSNNWLSSILGEKGVGHALHVWPGEAHCAADWRRMVPYYV